MDTPKKVRRCQVCGGFCGRKNGKCQHAENSAKKDAARIWNAVSNSRSDKWEWD